MSVCLIYLVQHVTFSSFKLESNFIWVKLQTCHGQNNNMRCDIGNSVSDCVCVVDVCGCACVCACVCVRHPILLGFTIHSFNLSLAWPWPRLHLYSWRHLLCPLFQSSHTSIPLPPNSVPLPLPLPYPTIFFLFPPFFLSFFVSSWSLSVHYFCP